MKPVNIVGGLVLGEKIEELLSISSGNCFVNLYDFLIKTELSIWGHVGSHVYGGVLHKTYSNRKSDQ